MESVLIGSLNPLLVLIGFLLTGLAVYISLELITHFHSMKTYRNFLYIGSSFSFVVGIWMMSFFGIIAFDIAASTDRLIIVSIVASLICYILVFTAFVFILDRRHKRNIYIGSCILSAAALVTNIIEIHVLEVQMNFNVLLVIVSFFLLTAFFAFAFWLMFNTVKGMTSAHFIKLVSSALITIAIGQGFFLVLKASIKTDNASLLFQLSLNDFIIPFVFLTLAIIVFTVLMIWNLKEGKRDLPSNLYSTDIMTALNASSIVCITDIDGSFLYANDRFVEITKYPLKELLNHHYKVLEAGFHDQAFYEELKETISSGENWKGELACVNKDGEIFWIDAMIIPFVDNRGVPFQYVAISKEITDKKVVEKELRKAMKEMHDYKYALDEASIVAITDAKGKITKANKKFCEISKYSEQELIGSDHRILNSGYHPSQFFKELWATIGRGEVWRGEIQNKAKDGSLYWVETTIIPFLNEKKKPYQYVSIRNDITEKKKQEEVLHRQEKLSALGQLAAGVAHEIRNPLTSMKGYTEFLLMDEKEEVRREHFDIILDEIERVNDIVEEFMLLAKPKADLLAVKNVNSIISNTLSLFMYELKKKKVDLSFKTDIPELPVLCDEQRLKQVFINFIKNSVEAMPTGGQLSITVEKHEQFAKIVVSDTGIGIPKDKLSKIGDPFFTTKENGTGLGLMISFKIIQSHNGKLEIDSKENAGTTLTILLPLHENV
ncbi:PAS domain-containing protein [Bacillus sp. AGMB 02131]|uniref:histidine kinase n=1 Tax=Peribacillus faecalis TaxID=2772559 RepID=A0A927D2P2_9BACI|nr:PAS domain-containing protein [Peribacillus faecalis]MBD3109964.1 PAS domain-containing protein [Peribacillus faecalis]